MHLVLLQCVVVLRCENGHLHSMSEPKFSTTLSISEFQTCNFLLKAFIQPCPLSEIERSLSAFLIFFEKGWMHNI